MIEVKRILCPIDFSDHSRRALDHAVTIARWYDATVAALHVYSVTPVVAYGPGTPVLESVVLTPEDREQLTTEITRFVEAEGAPGVPLEVMLREGNDVHEILMQASDMKADLLVVGTHGRSGFERLVLGSVAEKVLRKAECPVLSVPSHAPDAVPSAPGLFTRILCAIDFSDASTLALTYAMSLAQEANAKLTVVHVMQYDMGAALPVFEGIEAYGHLTSNEFRRSYEERCREHLEKSVPDAVRAYCSVETILKSGKAYEEILRVAAEQQSDLIAIGVHGRNVADRMFFGSTTNHIVRQATCPVLALRQR